ncbi:WD-repeat protein [Penicillium paradoxum]|uniref:WD-repeat protein n=1 Tax=Penicillium paradoxum TaxID=176176 RepID=UPI00254819FD|nr:WD-repeat protein [Penicillium paradoxum]KAJ5774917.1 WD-repeat protein [Penicillium paradoxum]
MAASRPSREEFQVGWICALPVEAAAAKEMLDENFGILEEQDITDPNSYTLGRVGKHYVVIACLPDGQYATTSATTVANNMLRTFSTSLRIGLMVGIGGGIPSDDHDIRLGDIVVSRPEGSCGGVVQYDKGKIGKDGKLDRTGSLNSPPRSLLNALASMRAALLTDDPEYPEYLRSAIGRNRKTQKLFARPEPKSDRLFKTEHDHPRSKKTCDECPREWEIIREEREDADADAESQTHYGIIASGNSVVKDGATRDQIRKETGALCFEMEAAGLMQDFPCIVIRGICDYSDSHKSKQWQGYAALVAAAYTKELLNYVPRGQVPQERLAADLTKVYGEIKDLKQDLVVISRKFDLQGLLIAPDAAFDSYENIHDECLPGTRIELLNEIEEWAKAPDQKCIFWLQGMAGTGKSTISRTVASRLKQADSLGASFFFKRGEADRGNAKRLFPTIANQLVRSLPQLLPYVQRAIGEDPHISDKALREQFSRLILQPLLSVETSGTTTTLVIIDALDECDRDDDIRALLWLLPQVQRSTSIRIRFFLTSRPERQINRGFQQIANDRQHFILHEIPAPVIRKDITLYFEHQILKLREEQEQERGLSPGWPGEDIFNILIERAIPLFISAATLCRFLRDRSWDPDTRLKALLADQTSYVSKMGSTYMPVLNQLLHGRDRDESQVLIQDFKDIVGVIIVLAAPLSVNALSRLLDRQAHDVSYRLDHLHSVLDVPANRDHAVRSLHQSFPEFLLDRRQKENNPFWVDGKNVHQKLVTQCLKAMACLRQNICNLENYATPKVDIDSESIHQNLLPQVRYSCRYWVHHLVNCTDIHDLVHDVHWFLQTHFLHWVEAMSLLGFAFEVVDRYPTVVDFLHDAKRFILKNCYMVDETPLQLYCAGLAFTPHTAIIRRSFETDIPSWVCRLPQVEATWSAELQVLDGHPGYITTIAFSPNDQLLASGSADNTVRLWDTTTGALSQTLEGHVSVIASVVFSPDGRLLVTGSDDKTIQFWDPTTGALQRTIESPSGPVRSVSISPDSRLVVSGADDRVWLWKIATGELHSTLEGHSGFVTSVSFSPNGRIVASGSTDMTVRLWDPITGALQRSLDISSFVHSVVFSPDGKLLASGSRDGIARLWDPATGVLLYSLSHSGDVDSVAFSPSSDLLVTHTTTSIQVWGIATGVLQRTLDHSSSYGSMAFSHDGKLLATGTLDGALRLWDLAASECQSEHEKGSHPSVTGHLGSIRAISFSLNGQVLASISGDGAVRLWDAETGAVQRIISPVGYVCSVALSSDGQQVTCRSRGWKFRVWNTVTGKLRHSLDANEGETSSAPSVVFSPDGLMLAINGLGGVIRLWDLVTGTVRQRLKGHSDDVQFIRFSPNSRLLASAFSNQTVCLWDLETGSMQRTWKVDGSIAYLEFSPDGSCIATNLGLLSVQPGHENCAACLTHLNKGVFDTEDQWIKINGKNVLRIPPYARAQCFAVHGNLFALGHQSGQISFIEFSAP